MRVPIAGFRVRETCARGLVPDLSITVVSAADAAYFDLLEGLVLSLKAAPRARDLPVSILDLGLDPAQRRWLESAGARLVEPGWDVEFPGRERLPRHFQAMTARPYLPKHFPGHDIYLWLDADTWVQDDAGLEPFIGAARRGKLAIVPEIDRGYWTIHKRPKPWGQNQKAFAWAYGLKAGYRLGRNAILNTGAFALRADAPHWARWAAAHARALNRRRWGALDIRRLELVNSEQTALNYVVFAEGLPASFLPAYCNWFCGKGTPAFDRARGLLVEPHEPHQPLAVVHLAGKGMKERLWRLETLDGGAIETRLTWQATRDLAAPPLVRPATAI